MTGLRQLTHLAILAFLAQAIAFAHADPWQDCKQASDPDLAIEACTTILATADGDDVIQGDYFRAIAYFNKHDFYHAAKDFTAVLDIRPVQIAYIDRGLAYENQMADDPEFANSAISDLTAAANLEPALDDKTRAQFWPAYLTRAMTNLKNGADPQAESDEEEALQLRPDNAQSIHASFAQAYEQRAIKNLADGQYDQSIGDFQKATTLDPTTADKLAPYLSEAQSQQPGPYAAIARGEQHSSDQDYEQAIKDYTDAVEANPQLPDARLNRGYAYLALDRFDNARADFDEAIRLAPNNWLGFYARGQLDLSVNQFDKAGGDFDQASAVIEQAHDLGYTYEKGQIDNARKKLKFDSSMQDHWISYLKEIQAADTYPNWSGPPYDLFVKNHSLQDVALVQNSGSPASSPPTDNARRRRWSLWVLGLLALLLVVGICCGAAIRRRRI